MKRRDLAEGSHGLSRVRGDKSRKKRNGSCKFLFGEESEDTDLSQSSVVQFSNKSPGFGLFALVLVEAKGIIQVEWDRVRNSVRLGELGEFTWFSAPHVVLSVGFRKVFQESNEKDDLPFGTIGKSIPLLRRGTGVSNLSGVSGPGEVDSVGLGNVSNKSGHSNTPVLDLCMAQEANSCLVTLSPNVGGSQLKRIIVLWWFKFKERKRVSIPKPLRIIHHVHFIFQRSFPPQHINRVCKTAVSKIPTTFSFCGMFKILSSHLQHWVRLLGNVLQIFHGTIDGSGDLGGTLGGKGGGRAGKSS